MPLFIGLRIFWNLTIFFKICYVLNASVQIVQFVTKNNSNQRKPYFIDVHTVERITLKYYENFNIREILECIRFSVIMLYESIKRFIRAT